MNTRVRSGGHLRDGNVRGTQPPQGEQFARVPHPGARPCGEKGSLTSVWWPPAFHEYIRPVAASGTSVADEPTKLGQLRDTRTITEDECQAHEAQLLATGRLR